MTNRLIINVSEFETRAALLENSVLSEMFFERRVDKGIAGSIYIGRVQRVLPGMQAAFVDLGLAKAAFLYVGDVFPFEYSDESSDIADEDSLDISDVEEKSEIQNDKEEVESHKNKAREDVRIEHHLKAGQEILVQVAKDPIGTKGPRITCNISLPGRHVVFMPKYNFVKVSRKILEDKERNRLKMILAKGRPEQGGFVARTVSQGIEEEKLLSDCAFLVALWDDIVKRSSALKAPKLVQPELDLVLKCARDMTKEHLEKIIIDDKSAFTRAKRFLKRLDAGLEDKIELYEGKESIFDHFGIESELARALSRKVWLRSGGYLIIDQAEALSVIDVNTGKYVGKRNLEDTILRTNLEAVREVAYQLRLRNIGGMVVIDFIDMLSEKNKDKVLSALNESLKKDRAKCNVVKISELGLVEMTRQRTRESLGRMLCEPCFYCDGKGVLRSKRTIAYEIFRRLEAVSSTISEPCITVNAHPEVVDMIYGEEGGTLSALETTISKQILVRPRGSFHQEQYDIFGSIAPKKEKQK